MFPQPDTKPPALKDEATRLRVWIEGDARAAMADKRYAYQAGIAPVSAMPLLDAGPSGATEAEWLRGAVQALLPRGWSYRIDEDVAGGCCLVLTEYWGLMRDREALIWPTQTNQLRRFRRTPCGGSLATSVPR
jgi:hypothetical protein